MNAARMIEEKHIILIQEEMWKSVGLAERASKIYRLPRNLTAHVSCQ